MANLRLCRQDVTALEYPRWTSVVGVIDLDGRDQPAFAPAVRDQIVSLLPRLRRFCHAVAGSPGDGDDLAQTTVERALTRIDQWEPGTRLDSWMFRIAQNANTDAARSRRRHGVATGVEALEFIAGDDGRRTVEARSALEHVRQAISALPDDQRAIVALVVVDGQSYRDTASILNIPIGTVMSRLARARLAIDARVNPERSVHG